jgi:hypothetical protein
MPSQPGAPAALLPGDLHCVLITVDLGSVGVSRGSRVSGRVCGVRASLDMAACVSKLLPLAPAPLFSLPQAPRVTPSLSFLKARSSGAVQQMGAACAAQRNATAQPPLLHTHTQQGSTTTSGLRAHAACACPSPRFSPLVTGVVHRGDGSSAALSTAAAARCVRGRPHAPPPDGSRVSAFTACVLLWHPLPCALSPARR